MSLEVTAAAVADYLRPVNAETRTRVPRPKPTALEVLIVEEGTAYVRWPNGSIRWESVGSLQRRGFPVPARGILQARP